MGRLLSCGVAASILAGLGVAWAADPRSAAVRTAFQRAVPCPSTQATRGPCPGYEADHVVPLCRGGADEPANLRWLTIAGHREKTRADRRACRSAPR